MIPSYASLEQYRRAIDAPWFTSPFDLNLIIARSGNVGIWDDQVLFAFTDDGGRNVVEAYTATGDAWEGEWTDPSNAEGCIYILDQHVPGGLELGKFKNRRALRQQKPYEFVRWPKEYNRIPTVAELEALDRQTGNQGTHIHNRVSGLAPLKPGTDDSEGCTVFLYQHQYAGMLRLVEEQKKRHGSTVISPTYCKLTALPDPGD